uniref:Uncharacterized protein n=1 Tax=Anguilla anguilla TaxID=7936 RepID=A0A0E9PMW3_ANGAN
MLIIWPPGGKKNLAYCNFTFFICFYFYFLMVVHF